VNAAATLDGSLDQRQVGRIPLCNIWLLMLYASDIARFGGRFDALIEEDVADLPDLVGRLLSQEVERRIRRNLSRGYRHRDAVLTRVRGRIDLLVTTTERLLDRGEVACRFDELTLDTARNRFVRAALERIARITSQDIGRRCRNLTGDLGRAGVSGVSPSRAELAKDRISRNDAEDRFMMALARLAFDLALPTEEAGTTAFAEPGRDEHWVRRLFEKAVGGFYTVELIPKGWRVHPGEVLQWPVSTATEGIKEILPSMRTDIGLVAPDGHRTVIDTKFTAIVTKGWYREESLKSAYLYQLYAYLRSQERIDQSDWPWNRATGILLHPAIGKHFDEAVTIQGHEIRFVTVDLSEEPAEVRRALRKIVLQASS
jgi:5-methylcytosine-specific restriction enzyme subunit McrC